MKKIGISYGIWIMTLLLFKWFFNEAYALLSGIFIIFPIGIMFLWTLALLVIGMIWGIKKKKDYKWKAAIPLVVWSITVIVCIFTSFQLPKAMIENQIYKSKRLEAIKEMKDKHLKEDGYGNVTLPKSLSRSSSDGNAYIYEMDSKKTIVGFWCFRGLLDSGYSSIVYSSLDTALNKDDIKAERIEKLVPLDSHWYYVSAE